MYEEKVILVDKTDNKIGLMNKMEAHQKGLLHRAFSIIIFNDKHEMLLQKRASTKYHTPNLWSNTCCSHQSDGENNISAGRRRLKEEMGFDVDLYKFDSFIYKAFFSNGLIEHEYDHILIGLYNNNPKITLKSILHFENSLFSEISFPQITTYNIIKIIAIIKQTYCVK